MGNNYDLIIIGAGPAGLSASIYASRYGIKHIIIGSLLGGQISETHLIDNYPGIEDCSGFEFSQKLGNHAKKYGVEILPKKVVEIKSIGGSASQMEAKPLALFEVALESGEKLQAKTILLGTGTQKRLLNVEGETEFLGKGVSYCATCDGFFYKNKTVAVVGGNDSAAGAALHLANVAEKVYIIYRQEKLRAEKFWTDAIEKNEKIEVVYNTNVIKVSGENKLQTVKLDKEYQDKTELNVDGLFIEIGSDPKIDFAKNLGITVDSDGYIEISTDGKTTVAGIWAAGDITTGSDKFKQVLTAASEGAIAARSISNFLKK
jgi:thioredoxin reductase (NADPH)